MENDEENQSNNDELMEEWQESVDKREEVREQVMKALKSVTWYISLLLTIAIVYRETAWKMTCETYTRTHQCTTIGRTVPTVTGRAGESESENAAGVMTMAVMIAMESSREKQTNTVQFDTDAMTIGVDNSCTACISDKSEHFVGKRVSMAAKPPKSCWEPYSGSGWTATG
jgi:hypothetical protein